MIRVITHFNIDLDAFFSTFTKMKEIIRDRAILIFKAANWNLDDHQADDIILDIDAHGLGVKGDVEEDGRVHSCYATLIREKFGRVEDFVLSNLVRFVDLQDSCGNAVRALGIEGKAVKIFSFTAINAVLRAFQTQNPRDDYTVWDNMSTIYEGMLGAARENFTQPKEILDAFLSIWFLRMTQGVDLFDKFFQDNMFQKDNYEKFKAALIKGTDNHSLFYFLVMNKCDSSDKIALSELSAFIEGQLSHENAAHSLGIIGQAADILMAASLHEVIVGYAYQMSYREVDEKMSFLLDGLFKNGTKRLNAIIEAKNAKWVGDVAVIFQPRYMGTPYVLLEGGAMAVISTDGKNIELSRRQDVTLRMDHLEIIKFTSSCENDVPGDDNNGWFYHSSGYKSQHGSRKAPASVPSLVDPMELAELVNRLLQENKKTIKAIETEACAASF